MATLFDAIAIMQNLGVYTVLLPFLLIFALVYGALTKFKPFGESKTINSIIAFALAFIFTASIKASEILTQFSVFFTAFLVMLLLLMLVFMFMGVKQESMAAVLKQPEGYGTIIVIFLLLFFIVFSQTFPESGLVTQNPEEAARLNITTVPQGLTPTQEAAAIMSALVTSIIFSPPILATMILLILFGVAAYFITREGGGKKGQICFSFRRNR